MCLSRLIPSFKSLYMVWLRVKKRRQPTVSRSKCSQTKVTRYSMLKVVSLSLQTVTILVSLVWLTQPVSASLATRSQSSVCSLITNASRNARVTISLKNTCAGDATQTVWNALMVEPVAPSATRGLTFRGIPVWSSAEWALNSKMRPLWRVIHARPPARLAPNQPRFAIHACR